MFCLYLLSFITCAVASSIQKSFATFTFQIRKAQGGNSFTGAVSHAAQPSHGHTPAHRSRKQHKLPPSRETEARPTGKRTRSYLNPHPLEAASSLPQELGDRYGHPGLGPLCCKGAWPAAQQHLQRGPRMKAPLRARALERFVPAQGCHIQPQAYKGQNPLVLHLKQKPRKMTFRKSHTMSPHAFS